PPASGGRGLVSVGCGLRDEIAPLRNARSATVRVAMTTRGGSSRRQRGGCGSLAGVLCRGGQIGAGCGAPRQADLELGEFAGDAVDFDRAAMRLGVGVL